MKYILLLITLLLFTSFASATGGAGTQPPLESKKWFEDDYVKYHCKGEVEYYLPDRAFVDCLTETHAIEYDYGKKWAESLGQALYYSAATGKKPGIVLIVEPETKDRYLTRLNKAISIIPCKPSEAPCIDIWTIEKR